MITFQRCRPFGLLKIHLPSQTIQAQMIKTTNLEAQSIQVHTAYGLPKFVGSTGILQALGLGFILQTDIVHLSPLRTRFCCKVSTYTIDSVKNKKDSTTTGNIFAVI